MISYDWLGVHTQRPTSLGNSEANLPHDNVVGSDVLPSTT